MKPLLQIVGAFVALGLVGVWLVYPGLRALYSGSPQPVSTSPSAIAFAENDPELAVVTESRMLDARPNPNGKTRLYFGFNFGDSLISANQSPPEVFATVDAHPHGGLDESPAALHGVTVLLSGSIGSGLESCDNSSVIIHRDVKYQNLTDTEEAAAVAAVSGQQASNGGNQETGTGGQNEFQTPGDVADTEEYTTLQVRNYFLDPRGLTLTNAGVTREYDDYYNFFTCTFASSAFWDASGDTVTFHYPNEIAASAGQSPSTVIDGTNTVHLISSPTVQLVSTEGHDTTALGGDVWESKEHENQWNTKTPQVKFQSITATYSNTNARAGRELDIFLGGIGISIAGTLLIAILKTFVLLIAGAVSRWRHAAIGSTS